MGKVLLINGSPNEKGCTNRALQEVASTLEKNDIQAEIMWIGNKAIQDCLGCGKCADLKHCVFNNDLVNETVARLNEFDGLIVGSPVYYAGPNGRLISFLDRLFYSSVFGGGLADLSGKFAASVVSCRRGGNSASFDRLNKYFGINNMHIVGSQYWNQVHGFTAEDVEKDLEGLQTMRTLGQNMAYLIKCKEAAIAAGVKPPVYEDGVYTNFIR